MTETMDKLFEDSLKDLYNAEKQFLKAMPKLAKAAQSKQLVEAIQKHIAETEGHVTRLEKAAEILGFKPIGKVCKAAQGLVEEAVEHLEEIAPGPVLDAAIVVCAQKSEHYEICSYGTLISWARDLGRNEVAQLLEQTLEEEKNTDMALSKLAETKVNKMAEKTDSKSMTGKATVR